MEVLDASACDVAVMMAEAGSPAATGGAVKLPPASIVPAPAGETVQLTAVLFVLPTLAVKACVDDGHPVLFGQRLADAGLNATVTGGLLPPPQAMNVARTASAKHVNIADDLGTLRPQKPSATTPASGKVKGSHGERLSERWRFTVPPGIWFGPVVAIVRLTVCVPVVPDGIEAGVNMQLLVASIPEHAKVTSVANVPAGVVEVTVNAYPVAEMPASTVADEPPVFASAKSGAITVTTAGVTDVEGALLPSPA